MGKRELGNRAVIGRGYNSVVYSWDAGRVLKLFHREIGLAAIERELKATQAIHSLGLPVPQAFDLVEVDGKQGIVFEQIHGVSLLQQAQAKPWTLFMAAEQLADLHARIHACEAPSGLISQREWIQRGINNALDLSDRDREQAKRELDQLAEGNSLCHGDFHPGNVLVTSSGPVIIDWGTATRGNPFGDVACTSRLMLAASLPSRAPFYMHLLLRVFRSTIHRTYLNRYSRVRRETRVEINKWQAPLTAAARGWFAELPSTQ